MVIYMDIDLSKEEIKLLRNAYKDFTISSSNLLSDVQNVMKNESCDKANSIKIIVKFMNNFNS